MTFIDEKLLCNEEIDELTDSTTFTASEIIVLYERFKFIDRDNNGTISYKSLMMLPEFHSNPLSNLILIAMEETLNQKNLTFGGFLEIMEIFSKRTDKKARCEFFFKAFDLNKNGKLCVKVMERIYKLMNGDGCDESQMAQEVMRVMNHYDRGAKGYMNYKDFVRFYNSDQRLDLFITIDFNEKKT